MFINLKISDDLYNTYFEKYGKPLHYSKMKDAIDFMKDIDPNDRYFIVNGENRRKLEKIFDIPIEDQTDLVKKCSKLSNFKIGDIGISFTADELERFTNQASFLNETGEQFMLRVANDFKNFMLDRA